MQLGFILSLSIHIALLAWAVLSIQRTPDIVMPETVAVSVAIVTPSEVTRMKQGDQNTKNLESKAADKPSEDDSQKEAAKPKAAAPTAAEPPPPEPAKPEPVKAEPPLPAATAPPTAPPDPIEQKIAALPPEKAPEPQAPEPAPGPTPEEQAAQAAKLEAERRAAEAKAKAEADKKRKEAEAKKKAEAERKKKLADAAAAKAKAEAEKKFDPNKLADLINKADDGPQKALIDKSNKPAGAKPTGDSRTATNLGPSAGTKDGRSDQLTATERDMLTSMLNSQLIPHYRLAGGGGGSDTPVVVVHFRLKPDGSLDGEPEIRQRQNSPLFNVAVDAAIRAVKEGAPFSLPPDKYSAWKDNNVEFDPRQMLK